MEESTAATRAAFVRSDTGQVPTGGRRQETHMRDEGEMRAVGVLRVRERGGFEGHRKREKVR